ncbi:hypothetical protein MRB53_019511 [Persea americana]|uniref:Uncharacterized protein n=1 Tax=Persea americana TaxID=3435 RepID=A0ACC2KZH5_PERAE|nr:hypothetical protein MRB53_019511 [Persea americana]
MDSIVHGLMIDNLLWSFKVTWSQKLLDVQFKQSGSGQIQSGLAPWLCNACSILWRTIALTDEGYFPSTLDGKLPPWPVPSQASELELAESLIW